MFGSRRQPRTPFLFIWIFCNIYWAIGTSATAQLPLSPLLGDEADPLLIRLETKSEDNTLPTLLGALNVLQTDYFEVWQGVWPTSIDWTSAVIGTYLSSALITLSKSFPSFTSSKTAENLVNKYFSELIASYFGQEAFALRQEAYDDMLWVVLGWLESIKFINGHDGLHYGSESKAGKWYGKQWIPAFAHRARIFWDMASEGWDTSLCDGGMIWSPHLLPYKNAITNELFIAASVSMYLYFPGDDNTSPFELIYHPNLTPVNQPVGAHDPKYLAAAIKAYRWLINSNMTDSKGLYVDGYHISGLSPERPKNSTGNTRCDSRNEMVYTYNQGVLLTGQRGLYESTGDRQYLEDGHELISNVISATGWSLKHGKIADNLAQDRPKRKLGQWHGLGRSGIIEEACDARGFCTQDAQTFKGIFFHHLTFFCSSLPNHIMFPDLFLSKEVGNDMPRDLDKVKNWHDKQCMLYGPWIKHNAEAALTTVDADGRFGMWWGAPPHTSSAPDADVELPPGAVDYRNLGVPEKWRNQHEDMRENESDALDEDGTRIEIADLNDRGRGRTVETQGGGVSVLRAMWEIVDTRRESLPVT